MVYGLQDVVLQRNMLEGSEAGAQHKQVLRGDVSIGLLEASPARVRHEVARLPHVTAVEVDPADWRQLVARADPSTVAFADRALELRWVNRKRPSQTNPAARQSTAFSAAQKVGR